MRVRLSLTIIPLLLAFLSVHSAASQGNNSSRDGEVVILRLDGSTTLFDPFEAIIASYLDQKPGLSLHNLASSSGHGIAALIDGSVDIARSSRPLNGHEYASALGQGVTLREIHIGNDGVVVIVHPDKFHYLKKLSLLQLRKIFFNGSINDWRQLDGNIAGKIHVYVRNSSDSGTAEFFSKAVAGDSQVPFVAEAQVVGQTPLLARAVASDRDGIAFLPANLMSPDVRMLGIALDEQRTVSYSLASLRKGLYPLLRPLYLFVRDQRTPAVDDFIFYVMGREVSEIFHRFEIDPAS